MELRSAKNIIGYTGRFILIYLVTYLPVALLFMRIQAALPGEFTVALNFFEPYSLGSNAIVIQVLRGLVMALVLYPFYDLFVKNRRGMWVLFAALWGIALLGSLEPTPGSIEGIIYTQTTLIEHLLVMMAAATQVLLFAYLFLMWERAGLTGPGKPPVAEDKPQYATLLVGKGPAYAARFTLLHLAVYWLVGAIFYQVSGYEEALATMETFELYRSLESFGMVSAVFFGQIIRGLLLAFLLLPFYDRFMKTGYGWLLLFGLLFGLMVLVVIIFIPAAVAELEELKVGIPEITVQTLLLSVLFFAWERRRLSKAEA